MVHSNLGIIYLQKGNDKLALYHLNRAVQTDLNTGIPLRQRGEYWLSKNDYEKALSDLKKCLLIHKDTYGVSRGIATACAGLGQWEKALEYTRICHDHDPKRIE